jgi:hypothetical protein
MNVEDPYPESQMVGTLDMQKSIARPDVSGQLGLLTNLGLPNTQQDVMDRLVGLKLSFHCIYFLGT